MIRDCALPDSKLPRYTTLKSFAVDAVHFSKSPWDVKSVKSRVVRDWTNRSVQGRKQAAQFTAGSHLQRILDMDSQSSEYVPYPSTRKNGRRSTGQWHGPGWRD
jgi:hypothetical protein